MFTAKKPFIPLAIFKDRNFVGGLVLMFVMGLVLLASSALLSPYLQNLSGRTVTQTGLLMVPRGLGTMFAMMFAGRLAMKMDPRCLMTVGAVLLVWSMWAMTGWTPDISVDRLSVVTFVQGIGMGLVFVPMNLVAFATLPPQFRTDGAGADQPDAQYRQRHRRFASPPPCSPTACRPFMSAAGALCLALQPRVRRQRAIHDHESADPFRHGQASTA